MTTIRILILAALTGVVEAQTLRQEGHEILERESSLEIMDATLERDLRRKRRSTHKKPRPSPKKPSPRPTRPSPSPKPKPSGGIIKPKPKPSGGNKKPKPSGGGDTKPKPKPISEPAETVDTTMPDSDQATSVPAPAAPAAGNPPAAASGGRFNSGITNFGSAMAAGASAITTGIKLSDDIKAAHERHNPTTKKPAGSGSGEDTEVEDEPEPDADGCEGEEAHCTDSETNPDMHKWVKESCETLCATAEAEAEAEAEYEAEAEAEDEA